MKKTVALLSALLIAASMPMSALAAGGASVKVETNVVEIGTRMTPADDIIITEIQAGAFEKGKSIYLQGDHLTFEEGVVAEVTEGDLQIDGVFVDDDILKITIKRQSSEYPSVIRLSNINLYLDEDLPEGDYPIKLITIEDDYFKDNMFGEAYGDGENGTFTTEYKTLLDSFVKIVVPDRTDKITSPNIEVEVGKEEMKTDGESIKLEASAYISDENRVMMPVRAITNALTRNTAIVSWSDSARTVTIMSGERIVSISADGDVMDINGVKVPMEGKAEIKDGRIFIPLRDIAHAFGISDDKISWDDESKTVTFN